MAFGIKKGMVKAMVDKAKDLRGGTGAATPARRRGGFGSLLGRAASKVAEKAKSATASSAGMAGTAMKKGGMVKKKATSDMAGRALKRKTADAKGRAMKKGK